MINTTILLYSYSIYLYIEINYFRQIHTKIEGKRNEIKNKIVPNTVKERVQRKEPDSQVSNIRDSIQEDRHFRLVRLPLMCTVLPVEPSTAYARMTCSSITTVAYNNSRREKVMSASPT